MDKNFRDMCAIMAMQGVIASPTSRVAPDVAAMLAFEYADAMTAERQRREAAEPRVVPR